MKPTDETIYNGMNAEGTKGNEASGIKTSQTGKAEGKKETWKLVSLSGASGILMGAGAIYAANAMAANSDGDQSVDSDSAVGDQGQSLQVAGVTPGKSFSQAFAEAREEVGPGGVFHWRGGIYNTYLKEEWDAMSPKEKNDFAARVNPEYGVDKIDTDKMAENNQQVILKDDTTMDKDLADNHDNKVDTEDKQDVPNDEHNETQDKKEDAPDEHSDKEEALNNDGDAQEDDTESSDGEVKSSIDDDDDVHLIGEDTEETITINGNEELDVIEVMYGGPMDEIVEDDPLIDEDDMTVTDSLDFNDSLV